MRLAAEQAFERLTRKFEGYEPGMYLDVKGLVTVGYGFLVDDEDPTKSSSQGACKLGFVHKSDGTFATPFEIDNEWRRVKALQDHTQFAPEWWQEHAVLILPPAEMTRELIARKNSMEMYLRLNPSFKLWDEYPAGAQLALMSMSWAMGPSMPNFPRFKSYMSQMLFTLAATECKMDTTNNNGLKIRNAANVEMLVDANKQFVSGTPDVLCDMSDYF